MGEDTTQEFPKNSLALILARIDSMESSLRAEIGKVHSRIDSLENRLSGAEEKVERRLMETRPIWEAVLARLDSLENRIGSVETQMERLFKRFDGVEFEVENLSLKFRSFQTDILRLQTRDERLAERLEKLENHPPT